MSQKRIVTISDNHVVFTGEFTHKEAKTVLKYANDDPRWLSAFGLFASVEIRDERKARTFNESVPFDPKDFRPVHDKASGGRYVNASDVDNPVTLALRKFYEAALDADGKLSLTYCIAVCEAQELCRKELGKLGIYSGSNDDERKILYHLYVSSFNGPKNNFFAESHYIMNLVDSATKELADAGIVYYEFQGLKDAVTTAEDEAAEPEQCKCALPKIECSDATVIGAKPGDVLLFTVKKEYQLPEFLDFNQYIRRQVEDALPGVGVIFAGLDAEVSVIKKEDVSVADENGTHRHPLYQWNPQKDITPHEIALCLPVLTGYSIHNVGEKYYIEAVLPKEAMRHFKRENNAG